MGCLGILPGLHPLHYKSDQQANHAASDDGDNQPFPHTADEITGKERSYIAPVEVVSTVREMHFWPAGFSDHNQFDAIKKIVRYHSY